MRTERDSDEWLRYGWIDACRAELIRRMSFKKRTSTPLGDWPTTRRIHRCRFSCGYGSSPDSDCWNSTVGTLAHRPATSAGDSAIRGDFPETTSENLAAIPRKSHFTQRGRHRGWSRRIGSRIALDSLESLDREILALRHFEQLTNGEAAEVLGLDNQQPTNATPAH